MTVQELIDSLLLCDMSSTVLIQVENKPVSNLEEDNITRIAKEVSQFSEKHIIIYS